MLTGGGRQLAAAKITRPSSSITSARLTAGFMNFGTLNQLKDGTEFHWWRMK
jgi:hypothetical protein